MAENEKEEQVFRFNKEENKRVIIISIAILFLIIFYFAWWSPRQECVNLVTYTPANPVNPEGYYTIGRGEPSTFLPGTFSTLKSEKFKTRSEAIRSCMNK